MDIRPIKTEADYQAALKEIEGLFDAVPNTPTGDRLEVLTTLVEAYEEQHYPIPSPDPVEAILYHMESRGLTRRDLEPYIGNRARVSEILNRKRSLSLRMIRQLHGGLGIPAEILPRIFDKFFRSPNAPTGGSGLGLTIVKGFVEAQGGTVSAENRPGGGAIFTLSFPQPEKPPIVEPG